MKLITLLSPAVDVAVMDTLAPMIFLIACVTIGAGYNITVAEEDQYLMVQVGSSGITFNVDVVPGAEVPLHRDLLFSMGGSTIAFPSNDPTGAVIAINSAYQNNFEVLNTTLPLVSVKLKNPNMTSHTKVFKWATTTGKPTPKHVHLIVSDPPVLRLPTEIHENEVTSVSCKVRFGRLSNTADDIGKIRIYSMIGNDTLLDDQGQVFKDDSEAGVVTRTYMYNYRFRADENGKTLHCEARLAAFPEHKLITSKQINVLHPIKDPPHEFTSSVHSSHSPSEFTPSALINDLPDEGTPSVLISDLQDKSTPSVQISDLPREFTPSVLINDLPSEITPSVPISGLRVESTPSVHTSDRINESTSSGPINSKKIEPPTNIHATQVVATAGVAAAAVLAIIVTTLAITLCSLKYTRQKSESKANMEDVTPSDISMRHETGDRLQQRIAPAHTYESIDEIVIGTSDHLRCQTEDGTSPNIQLQQRTTDTTEDMDAWKALGPAYLTLIEDKDDKALRGDYYFTFHAGVMMATPVEDNDGYLLVAEYPMNTSEC